LKIEREHGREITNKLIELTSNSQELTRNSQVLLKQEQDKSTLLLADERAQETQGDNGRKEQQSNKGFFKRLFKNK